MNYVNQFLNFVSDGLLLPAVTLEIVLLFWALWAMGLFAREYWTRVRTSARVREALAKLRPGDPAALATAVTGLPEGQFRSTLADLVGGVTNPQQHDRRLATRLISAFEGRCQRELDTARLLARLGPILGLMGTLIPKGHALGQLALGDVSAMTQNLQVAFANTVVGLFIGALGFVMQQGRQRWYQQELDTLDYVYELVYQEERR